MEKETLYDQIEAYLHNEMDEAQKSAFELRIASDPELQQEIILHKDLEHDLSGDVVQLRKSLKEITEVDKKTLPNIKNSAKIYNLIYRYAAIAAIFILGIVFLPKMFNPSTNLDTLYETYYESYPMALNQRSNDGSAETTKLNAAINNYLNQNYKEAASGFKKLYEDDQNSIYLLYQAHSLMADKAYEEAFSLYDIIMQENNPALYEQCLWYKGLALLQMNQKDDALAIYNSAKPSHYKYDEIQQIIRKIK